MSRFSNRSDLYDHIYMIGCKGTDCNTSEKEKFETFKKRTNGLLHQRVLFNLDKYNIDREIKIINDERILCKKKVNNKWRYYYFGREYKTLDSLNKRGYYCTIDIPFDTMLDLVKYYGYTISSMGSDVNSECIYISNESEIDERRKSQYFRENNQNKFYGEKELIDEYIRLVKEYY